MTNPKPPSVSLTLLVRPQTTLSVHVRAETFTWDKTVRCGRLTGLRWGEVRCDDETTTPAVEQYNVKYTDTLSVSLSVTVTPRCLVTSDWTVPSAHWLDHSWSLPYLARFSLSIIHQDLSVVYLHLHRIIQIHNESITGELLLLGPPAVLVDEGELVEILTLSPHTANSSSIVFTHTDWLLPVLLESLHHLM